MNQIFIEDIYTAEKSLDKFWVTWSITDECKICGVYGDKTKLYPCWSVHTVGGIDNNPHDCVITTTGYRGAVCNSKVCQEMIILQNI